MAKSTLKPKIKASILKCLESGEKTTGEIKKLVSGKPWNIDRCLHDLKNEGKVKNQGYGKYTLSEPLVEEQASETEEAPPAVKNVRGESENTETINKVLNLYDKLLDAVAKSIEKGDWEGVESKIEAIKSLRWLGATVDQLMKRWYLVHRGYDSNTKQAEADLKEKQQIAEKAAEKSGLVEDEVTVVAHWHPQMQKFFMGLPGTELKELTEEELTDKTD